MIRRVLVATTLLCAFFLVVVSAGAATKGLNGEAPAVAWQQVGATGLAWEPVQQFESVTLVVSGPQGLVFRGEFPAGIPIFYDLVDMDGYGLPDGAYKFELTGKPILSAAIRAEMEDARNRGLSVNNGIERRRFVQSGVFSIRGGSVVDPDLPEPEGLKDNTRAPRAGITAKDQVILDDLIVDGSICAGLDCVNGESFGFDTIRLKENNLRIRFQDTSNSASFPTFDWQLVANDSSNGGLNRFSIEDVDSARTPFTVEGGADANALYVDTGGRIGISTNSPVVELHIKDGDTPTLRLEQDGSSGFTAQTWDVAGNETNFFIRDVTNGSTLPLRIRPSAPSNSIFVDVDGDVGMGTSSPDSSNPADVKLHLRGTDGNTALLVEEASSTNATRTMFELRNNGDSRFEYEDTATGERWQFTAQGANDRFVITNANSGVVEMTINAGGNVTIPGTLTAGPGGSTFPDYVFDEGYQLLSLADLKDYVTTEKRLPGIPSAQSVHESGQINISELQIKMLEKIEELVLYTLQQESEITHLKARLAALEGKQ